jgi:hypothetical protein
VLFLEVLKQGVPVRVAVCSSDTLVRDPAFAPLLQQAVANPEAEPDAETLSAVRARVPDVFRECTK